MPSETVIVLNGTLLPARPVRARTRLARQSVDVHIARGEIRPGRGDANLWLGEIGIPEAHRTQHRPRRGLLQAIDDQARIFPDINGLRLLLH